MIGWTYETNRDKVKAAEKAIDDFNLQDNISDLQNAKEAEAEALQQSIDNWNDYLEMLEYKYQEYDRLETARTMRELLQVDTDEEVYNLMSQDMTNFVQYEEKCWDEHNTSMETLFGNYISNFNNFFSEYKNVLSEIQTLSEQGLKALDYTNYIGGNAIESEVDGEKFVDYDDLDEKYMKYASDVTVEGANYGVGDSEGKWKTHNGKSWYATSDNSYAAGGWYQIGNKWYYFDDEGYAFNMATGKYGKQGISDEKFVDSLYDVDSSNKKYYKWLLSQAEGYEDDDTATKKTKANSASYQTWQGDASYGTSNDWHKTSSGQWWYGSSSQYSSGGWQNIGGKWYNFDSSGYLTGNINGYSDSEYEDLIDENSNKVEINTKALDKNKEQINQLTNQEISSMVASKDNTVQLTTASGQVVEMAGYTINSQNQLVDSNGNVINSQGLVIDSNGNLVTSNGTLVASNSSLSTTLDGVKTSISSLISALNSYDYYKDSGSSSSGGSSGGGGSSSGGGGGSSSGGYSYSGTGAGTNNEWSSGSSASKSTGSVQVTVKSANTGQQTTKVMTSTQAKNYASLVDRRGFAGGIEEGPVTYTGLAMLHGTPTSPEYVLNSDQAYSLLRYMATSKPDFESNASTTQDTVYQLNGDIVLQGVGDPEQFWSDVTKAMDRRFSVTKNR